MLRECNPYYRIYKNIREITQEYEAQRPDMRVGITPQFKLFLETGEDRKRENLPPQYEVAALIPSEWAGNLRREVLHGLTDHLETDDADPHAVGQKVILPSSYHAGDRAMQQAFQNACALRRVYGATSLFITFTANPKWPEIVDHMHGHNNAM
jgi:Helitron helicase-like domain at N-terminus